VPVVVANITILTDFVILEMPEDDNMSTIVRKYDEPFWKEFFEEEVLGGIL
jgi:hypothetical protein